MKRTRFVVVIVRQESERAAWRARLSSLEGTVMVHDSGHLLVAIAGSWKPLGENGLLIGSVFDRAGKAALLGGEAGRLDAINLNRRLTRDHWGGYVTLAWEGTSGPVSLFRSPLGDLPCFWAGAGDALVIGSDLGLMMAAGLPRPRLADVALARFLAMEDLLQGETCLESVSELRGGEMLSLGIRAAHTECLWSPWDFASRSWHGHDRSAAENSLRDTAVAATSALAREQRGIVLKLSGGLDSSIVAACLAASGSTVTALNLVTADASGDEREHARRVCDMLKLPLIEAYRDPQKVSLSRPAHPFLPRPSARSFTQETARLCAEVAADTGARQSSTVAGAIMSFALSNRRVRWRTVFSRARVGNSCEAVRALPSLPRSASERSPGEPSQLLFGDRHTRGISTRVSCRRRPRRLLKKHPSMPGFSRHPKRFPARLRTWQCWRQRKA